MNQQYTTNFLNSSTKMYCRPQEYSYLTQIFHQYVKGHDTQLVKRMFQTLHSDWLNISTKPQKTNQNIQIMTAQTQYKQGDIILQIRGSIIKKVKLQQLIKEKPETVSFLSKVNCLLFGDDRNQVLIPKGLSKSLLRKDLDYMDLISKNQEKANCLIELQSGSKYLLSAQKQIGVGDCLILNLKSLQRHLYQPCFKIE